MCQIHFTRRDQWKNVQRIVKVSTQKPTTIVDEQQGPHQKQLVYPVYTVVIVNLSIWGFGRGDIGILRPFSTYFMSILWWSVLALEKTKSTHKTKT
jgi:hypothetical protein